MSVCTRCTIDKAERAYRHKTSGERAGYRFPVCIQCEGERRAAALAADLRAVGYTAEAIDPDVKQREIDDGAAVIAEGAK